MQLISVKIYKDMYAFQKYFFFLAKLLFVEEIVLVKQNFILLVISYSCSHCSFSSQQCQSKSSSQLFDYKGGVVYHQLLTFGWTAFEVVYHKQNLQFPSG